MHGLRIARVTLLASAAACRTVQPVSDPSRFIAETSPAVIHVLHSSGAVVDVEQPRVQGDSLYGIRYRLARPVAMPMNQIQRIVAVQPDRTRTILAVAGVTAAAATITYLVATGSGTGPNCDATTRFQSDPRCR